MQQFYKFITSRFCAAQHVSGAHHQERTIALGASDFNVGKWRLERC
jgi:hypothetical protein